MSDDYAYCPRCATRLEYRELFGKIRGICPACEFIHFLDPKVAVVVFIERSDAVGRQVLLIQRASDPEKGRWALPAGFVDHGEDPKIAAMREVSEETGLLVKVSGLLGVWRDNSAVIVIGYLAHVVGGTLYAGDDALDARWFGANNLPAPTELGFDSTRRILGLWQQHGHLDNLPVAN